VNWPEVNAQTGQRIDLHDLSQTEQQKLADLIQEWLVVEHPGIPEFHDLCFSEGIHSTNNFMPWHRVHIQVLEDYIRENANPVDFPSILNINDESFRLPKWQPEITPLGGAPKIPAPFQVRASGNPVGSMNFNPVPNTLMTDFLFLLDNCGTNQDAGGFSDQMEGNYHNQGHGIVGGWMTHNQSPDCLIFWPWHAWVDDLWYIWERDCQGNYDLPFLPGSTVTNINAPGTPWTGEMFVKGEVRVLDGATLTIAQGAIIHFRESQYNAFPTRIIVEPGGTLIVDGATLTGIDILGSVSNAGDPPGAKYNTAWEGIIVRGAPGNEGSVQLLNNARIEHAITGVRTENGGRIYAYNANFYNNRVDVEIGAHPGYQYAGFFYCNFINDQPLRDIVWMGSPLDATGQCPGGIPEHHINHEVSHSSEAHIRVNGNLVIPGFHYCTIDNQYQDPHGHYISRGIVANNSLISVYSSSIKNQAIGISARNTAPGPGRHVSVRNCTFTNNFEGVSLFGVDNSEISTGNTFIVPDEIPTGFVPPDILSDIGKPFGIYSDGSTALTVADNEFSTVGSVVTSLNNYGAILSNTASDVVLPYPNGASVEKRNTFTGVGIGSQAQGSNGNLQIRCNDYNSFQFGISVTSGALQTQGFNTLGASNVWDNINCFGDESQIYKHPDATPFIYWAYLTQMPTCVSPDVTPLQAFGSPTSTSCNDPVIPCPRCEESRIADLETEKNTLIPGDEKIQSITHEQQLIYQQGVNGRLENENEGLDSAITFTQNVEAITSLWPGNKAALLLLKSEQEGTIASGTASSIAAISESDPTKKWLDLRYDLLASGRTYSQLTTTEKAMVEAEAAQQTKSGSHAKAILEVGDGIPAQPHIEPINLERSSKPITAINATNYLNVVPNPANELAYVAFIAPETLHQSWLIVSDLNGRVYRKIDLSGTFGESQIPLSTADLSEGVYFLRLQLENQPSEAKKLIIVR